jgi:tripartite ATP-independent transporter DctM subunit
MFVLVVLLWGVLHPRHIPGSEAAERWAAIDLLVTVGPIVLIGLVITVSIYAGIATPTEAGAVAALLTVVLAFGVGRLTFGGFCQSLLATMRTMGYLGLLLSAGVLFGFVLTYYRVPQQFTDLFLSLELSAYMVLAIVIAFYIMLGMFLEPVSMTFITLPTIFPLMQAAGFDLIWFGVVYTITMEIAVLTPPVGLNLFVIQGIGRGQVSIGDVIIGCLPFIAALTLLIAILIAFPQAALWLPDAMN